MSFHAKLLPAIFFIMAKQITEQQGYTDLSPCPFEVLFKNDVFRFA